VVQVRFKNELERNITIKLGYANAKIYKCEDESCPRPQTYRAYGSSKEDAPTCEVPGFQDKRMQLLRHVSFVDCPGHDILMATMLNGAAVMDGALLLIAGACVVVLLSEFAAPSLCTVTSPHAPRSLSPTAATACRQRDVPAAADVGASGGGGDHAAGAHHHSAE